MNSATSSPPLQPTQVQRAWSWAPSPWQRSVVVTMASLLAATWAGWWMHPPSVVAWVGCTAWAVWLVALACHDAVTLRLPRVATCPAWGAGAVGVALGVGFDPLRRGVWATSLLMGCVVSGLWALASWWTWRRGTSVVGLGDAHYVGPTAMVLAWADPWLVAMWMLITSLLLVAVEGLRWLNPSRLWKRVYLPCGPFLAGAALIALPFWGTAAPW